MDLKYNLGTPPEPADPTVAPASPPLIPFLCPSVCHGLRGVSLGLQPPRWLTEQSYHCYLVLSHIQLCDPAGRLFHRLLCP